MEFDIYSNDDKMLYIIIALGGSTVLLIIGLFFYCCCCRGAKEKKPEIVKTSTFEGCQTSFTFEPEAKTISRR